MCYTWLNIHMRALILTGTLVVLTLGAHAAHWDVVEPREFTAPNFARLCAHMRDLCVHATVDECVRTCIVLLPPSGMRLPPGVSDASVLAAFPSAVRVTTVGTAAQQRLARAIHRTARPVTTADGGGSASTRVYEVAIDPWATAFPTDAECGTARLVSLTGARVALVNCTSSAAADRLATADGVLWVHERVPRRAHNLWNSVYIDRGTVASSGTTDALLAAFFAPQSGLVRWDDALDGRGQIIGTLDTGVDVNSAYMRDPSVSIAPFVDCGVTGTYASAAAAATTPLWYDRRKVVQYVTDRTGSGACGDASDADGHGTHTAATAAGAADCTPNTCASDTAAFDGHARGARVAVFDAGPDSSDQLVMPFDIATGVLPWAYSGAGARVHSDSWGESTSGVYSTTDYQVDAFVAANPDMIVVVSCGNTGDKSGTASRCTSPGIAKNALTVGAAVSTPAGNAAVRCGSGSIAPDGAACAALMAQDPMDVAFFSSSGVTGRARRAKPDLVAPGYFTISGANGQPAGGASGSVSHAGGKSAWAAGTVAAMAGTSMSAPLVAGLAAVVRQYFAHGYWPCGTVDSGTRWTWISAALVKAVLVGVARELTGAQLAQDGVTVMHDVSRGVSGYPNQWQGYGTPVLAGALRASGARAAVPPLGLPWLTGVATSVVGTRGAEPTLAGTGESVAYTVCAWGNSTLRAVLVWTDTPVVPGGAAGADTGTDLVNDLDLVVADTTAGAVLAYGNHEVVPGLTGLATRTSPRTQADRSSNVEVVTLRPGAFDPAHTLSVQVLGARVVTTQAFALVLVGDWGECVGAVARPCANATSVAGNNDGNATNSTSDGVVPFERVVAPGAEYVVMAFIGTSRACAASQCATAYDRTARVEVVFGVQTESSAAALETVATVVAMHTLTNATVAAPAPSLLDLEATSVRLSWVTRLRVTVSASAGAVSVYVSLPLQPRSGSLVSRRQRLVWAPFNTTTNASGAWRTPDADADLVKYDDDRTGSLASTSVRATGSTSATEARDALWAVLSTDDADSDDVGDVMCADDKHGCDCTESASHGFADDWLRVCMVFLSGAAMLVVVEMVFDEERKAARVAARRGAYTSVPESAPVPQDGDGNDATELSELPPRGAAKERSVTNPLLALATHAAVLGMGAIQADTDTTRALMASTATITAVCAMLVGVVTSMTSSDAVDNMVDAFVTGVSVIGALTAAGVAVDVYARDNPYAASLGMIGVAIVNKSLACVLLVYRSVLPAGGGTKLLCAIAPVALAVSVCVVALRQPRIVQCVVLSVGGVFVVDALTNLRIVRGRFKIRAAVRVAACVAATVFVLARVACE